MTMRTPKARQLATASELALFQKSLASRVRDLSEAEVNRAVTRTRKLRNKYRQLADRQEREARGKQDARKRRAATGNLRTREKQQLFQETLERYETRLSALAKKPAPRPKKGARAPGKKTRVPKKKAAARKKPAKKKKAPAAKKAAPKAPGRKKVAAPKASAARAKAKPKAKAKAKPRRPAIGAWTTGVSKGRGTKSKPKSEPKSKVRKTSRQTEDTVKNLRLRQTGGVKIQKHVGARARRAQAKRDSRSR